MTIGFAHRGAPRPGVRANSLAAFRSALARGATGLESDVWTTIDGVPVLDHDGLVSRLPRRPRPIGGLHRSELPRRFPSLADLYAQCGTAFELSLDIKDAASASAVVEVARAAGALASLWMCGPHDQVVQWRARAGDEVRLVDSARLPSVREGVAARARRLADAGVDALNLRQDEWNRERVSAVHEAGRLAFGWDAHRRREVDRLAGLGCDAVYSDHVRLLRRLD